MKFFLAKIYQYHNHFNKGAALQNINSMPLLVLEFQFHFASLFVWSETEMYRLDFGKSKLYDEKPTLM